MGRKVMELLRDAARKHNAGVVVVTHDHRAIDVFDRIWAMEDGKIERQKYLPEAAKDSRIVPDAGQERRSDAWPLFRLLQSSVPDIG